MTMLPIDKMIANCIDRPPVVLIVGDGMTDVYVRGRVEDTCQDGCPKFVEECRVTVPGGAANAWRAIEHWRTNRLLFAAQPGAVKTRFAEGGRIIFRADGDDMWFDLALLRAQALRAMKARVDAVLLSDYDKGTLTPEFIHEMVYDCAARNIMCVVDAKQAPRVYTDNVVLKCNSEYAVKWSGVDNQRLGYSLDVVTAGANPPYVGLARLPLDRLPGVNCVNHVGAGDCFGAHLALALACGLTLAEAATVAHSAGRVYVQHPHNRPPRPEEIRADMVGSHVAAPSTTSPG